jgi:hypothetical protein
MLAVTVVAKEFTLVQAAHAAGFGCAALFYSKGFAGRQIRGFSVPNARERISIFTFNTALQGPLFPR